MNNLFFNKLNALYRNLGTWKEVAKKIGVTDRSLRRYWEGTRTPGMALTRKVLAIR